MDENELEDLFQSPQKLCYMNNLLSKYQFPEYFLIKTIAYYDSVRCLKTQWDLSPYFCFRYLYDNDSDSSDDWTDFSEIYKYLLKNNHSNEIIYKEYRRKMTNKK